MSSASRDSDEATRRRVEELFHAALDLSPSERAAFLDEKCRDDRRLRAEVDSLLNHHDAASGFLEHDELAVASTSPPTPSRVGSYELLRLLGAGGMGVVHLARQENPRREVALKLLHPGLTTPELLRRFAQEAQVLGRLNHPGIAQVHEAGTTDDGSGPCPYVVMEHVDGVPLTQHATEEELGLTDRLELVIAIAEAVQHAHSKGVVHRDLKPANILVDRDGRPKVLDFGVARVLDPDRCLTSLHTREGQLVGTVAYMSPEQAAGDLEIDVRSDVHALGVTCYELVTGRLPHGDRQQPLPEQLRAIREDDPVRAGSLDPTLRGDLETILGKALEKDPVRRYPTATAFAADLRRFLDDRPIEARPPSTLYQLCKLARRHRALAIALGLVLLASLGTTVVLAVSLVRVEKALAETERQRRAARLEADKATALHEFFEDMLTAADPTTTRGRDVTVRELLAHSADGVDDERSQQPEIRAALRSAIGRTHQALGEHDDAERHLEGGWKAQQALLGDAHPDTLRSRLALGSVLLARDRLDEADQHFRAVRHLALERPAAPESDAIALIALHGQARGQLARGRLVEAEHLLRLGHARAAKIFGPASVECARFVQARADGLSALGRDEDAERLLRKALEGLRDDVGDDHPTSLATLQSLALTVGRRGRLDEAGELLARAHELNTRVFGAEHPRTLLVHGLVASNLQRRGQLDEAETIHRQVITHQQAVLGAEHRDTLTSRNNLAQVLQARGALDEATSILDEVLTVRRRRFGSEHPDTLVLMNNLARAHQDAGRPEDAAPLLAETLETRRRLFGDDHPQTLISINNLGLSHYLLDERPQAVPLFRECWGRGRATLGAAHPTSLQALSNLTGTLLALERWDDAEPPLRLLVDATAERHGADHQQVAIVEGRLGRCLLRLDRPHDALDVLERAHERLRERLGDEHRRTRQVLELLTEARSAVGR
ncbi:MAG: serine/threonine-protein kinase [Acidobacteriota bacterium]